MKEKDFIREKIVGRRAGRGKRLLRLLMLLCAALLFGFVAALAFALSEPRLAKLFRTETPESVELQSEESSEESREESSEESREETESEALEKRIRTEIESYDFPVSAYERMISNLKKVSSDAEKSLAEVRRKESGTDFLGESMDSENSWAGIILAKTGDELLVLCPIDAVREGGNLSISVLREEGHEASVKARDRTDRLAILSVPIASLSEKEREETKAIPLGNSRLLQRGDTLLAIGAPSGFLYSFARGLVSYLSYDYPSTDRTVENIQLNLEQEEKLGTYLLNSSGELVGILFPEGEGGGGYHEILGISDLVGSLERLSNGEQLPYLGLKLQKVTPEMEQRGIPKGIYIRGCEEGSPAFLAGIQSGDILSKLNEGGIESPQDLQKMMKELHPGENAELTVLRQKGQGYREISFPLSLGER